MAKKAITGINELYKYLLKYNLIEGVNLWHLSNKSEFTVASSVAKRFVNDGIVVEVGSRNAWYEATYRLEYKSIKTYSEWKKKMKESQE